MASRLVLLSSMLLVVCVPLAWASACTGEESFCDDFETGTDGWTVMTGNWALEDGAYSQDELVGGGNHFMISKLDAPQGENRGVEVDISPQIVGEYGCFISFNRDTSLSDASVLMTEGDYLMITLFPRVPRVSLYKREGGVTTEYATTVPLSPGEWYNVKAESKYGYVTVFINGNAVISGVPTTLEQGNLLLGTDANHCHFDNVKVYGNTPKLCTVDLPLFGIEDYSWIESSLPDTTARDVAIVACEKVKELRPENVCYLYNCRDYWTAENGWSGPGAIRLLLDSASIGHWHGYAAPGCTDGDDDLAFGYVSGQSSRLSHCMNPTIPGRIDLYHSGDWQGCHDTGMGTFSCEEITDADGDGSTTTEGDCDDTNPNVHPGAAELCDGIDNDCNEATVDGSGESWYGQATTCGTGVCAATGILTCENGQQVNTCARGSPTGTDDTCNGLDEDCDGLIDDGYTPVATSCGTGACGATGELQCVNGGLTDTCSAGAPAPETCNGIDDDCDGQVDESVDLDRDGVYDCTLDRCLGSQSDTLTDALGINRWIWQNGAWTTTKPKGTGTKFTPTMAYTHGCSCTQILKSWQGPKGKDFNGQYKYGCTQSTLETLHASITG